MKQIINDKSIFFSGLSYFVIMLCFIGARILFASGVMGDVHKDTTDFLFTFIVQILVLLCVPFIIMRFCAKQPAKTLFKKSHFKSINGRMVFWSLILGVCTYITILFASSFWAGIISIFGYTSSSAIASQPATDYPVVNLLLGILFVGVLPGFCEEFSHRGVVLGNIKKDGVGRAILISSLLFALMHLNIAQVGYAFVVGLILSTVTLLTKSIFPAMIIHCTSNSVSTYLSFASENNWVGGDWINVLTSWMGAGNLFASFIISTLILCLVVSLIFYCMFALFKNSKRNEYFTFKKRLAKNLKNSELGEGIDLNNDAQVFRLYQEAQLVNIQKKMLNSNLSLTQLENNVDKATVLSLMFDEDITRKSEIKHLDYIFYYCSICLGVVVTLFTLIWGII